MKLRFVDGVQAGKNEPWRYFIGILTVLSCWFGSVIVGLIVRQHWATNPLNAIPSDTLDLSAPITSTAVTANSLITTYSLNHLPFLFLGLSVLGVVKGLHQRHPLTLISPEKTFSYRRFWAGFGAWFVIAIAQAILEYCLQPEAFTGNFQFNQWIIFLPIALILTPIQTSAEELFFRGYLLQGMGLIFRRPWLLCLMASLPFALVHWMNPEMQRDAIWMGLAYFLLAFFLTAITLKDGRLELALGVHAANNLFVMLLVNTQDSVLQTPAVIVQQIPTNPRVTVLSLLVVCSGFYWFFFKRSTSLKSLLPR